MKGSVNLGRISGIKIGIHWTFLIIIAWVIMVGVRNSQSFASIMFTIGFVLLLFGCVVLHELGHSLTAKRYGIQTKDITLLPIGGLARLKKIPENPKQEFFIAIAGPAVNFAITLIMFLFYLAVIPKDISDMALTSMRGWQIVFVNLMVANFIIGVFNLIPAFPMDGGRILRAALAYRMNRLKATQIASSVGQFIAILFAIAGIFFNPFLILIGIVVYFGARYETIMVETFSVLRGHSVKEAMRTKFTTLNTENTVSEAANELLAGADEDFLVMNNSHIAGVLRRNDLIEALKENKTENKVADIMQKDIPQIKAEDSVQKIFTQMQEKGISILPVFEHEKLIGVIDQHNLSEFIMIQSAYQRDGKPEKH